MRYREMARECLDREIVTVETPLGPVRFKVARRGGKCSMCHPNSRTACAWRPSTCRPVKEIQALASLGYFSR